LGSVATAASFRLRRFLSISIRIRHSQAGYTSVVHQHRIRGRENLFCFAHFVGELGFAQSWAAMREQYCTASASPRSHNLCQRHDDSVFKHGREKDIARIFA
jgi:hypothetical protein